MPSLRDHPWQIKYSPDRANLLQDFYIPALTCAHRYWRTTGYFRATALALAMRGIEGLIHNQGSMRLIVGCTLGEAEILAIAKGESLQTVVETNLEQCPLEPPDQAAENALELLAWMVQHNILDVKVAVPCDDQRRPKSQPEIFHEKAGIIEDGQGDRIAFNGSINETANAWLNNWESFHVFTSWQTPDHVNEEDQSFHQLWTGQSRSALVLGLPQAISDRLLKYAPPLGQLPQRLQTTDTDTPDGFSALTLSPPSPPVQTSPDPEPEIILDPRTIVWSYIAEAPKHSPSGDWVGAATSAVTPWPHQVRAFQRMWQNWPPKLLIADEVGLGKTIQAGLLLRQAWLSDRAKRILVMAPAAVLQQWQLELREKFNLNWPIYDGKALNWYPSPGFQGEVSRPVNRADWHKEPFVLVSSHLMRRRERVPELIEQAEPWDLVVLDEAHHARRSGGTNPKQQRFNRLLSLMRQLKDRTLGLILLTATPMQVAPIEVWDLLQLLQMPQEWTSEDFIRFFETVSRPNPGHGDLAYLARLFRAIERDFGEMNPDLAKRFAPKQSKLKANKILKALRSGAATPLKQLETSEREATLKILQAYTPVRLLISRHTRELLRKYYREGKITTPIAERKVEDEFISLSAKERHVYDAVEDYISNTYNNAAESDRNAIGFVMTIYRKRLASSFHALGQTLENRLKKLQQESNPSDESELMEDLPDETPDQEAVDVDEARQLEIEALNLEESSDLESLLSLVRSLPLDTKTTTLQSLLLQLQDQGYSQTIIFTQFTDTLDFLREQLIQTLDLVVMCFSGRGGEVYQRDGKWQTISREKTKQLFAQGKAQIMLCTDAAAEGLNFQFCGAMINYDMPWNPMRVEQRIGRIDRLGQVYPQIKISNLHYKDTVETDVYIALKERINLFETVVGKLQPILANLPTAISNLVFSRREERQLQQEIFLSQLESETRSSESSSSLDLDHMTEDEMEECAIPTPSYTLTNLQEILSKTALLPPGIRATIAGQKDFSYSLPGMTHPVRVTTDPVFYDEHSDSVELWSPGNPLFPKPEIEAIEVKSTEFQTAIESCSQETIVGF